MRFLRNTLDVENKCRIGRCQRSVADLFRLWLESLIIQSFFHGSFPGNLADLQMVNYIIEREISFSWICIPSLLDSRSNEEGRWKCDSASGWDFAKSKPYVVCAEQKENHARSQRFVADLFSSCSGLGRTALGMCGISVTPFGLSGG